MLLRFYGDIHGHFSNYKYETSRIDHQSVQIGDFGYGFDYYRDAEADMFFKSNPNHKFIRGNHDNLDRCKKSEGFIQDGTVDDDIMYVGGAWSIDYRHRTAGVDWWPNEEIADRQFELIYESYKTIQPRVMVTHDAPGVATVPMFLARGDSISGSSKLYENRTEFWLSEMYKAHQPDVWIFGHWHITREHTVGATKFICVGEQDYIDLDLETLAHKRNAERLK